MLCAGTERTWRFECITVVTWGHEAGVRSHHIGSSLVLETGQGGFWDREEVWALGTSFAQEAF